MKHLRHYHKSVTNLDDLYQVCQDTFAELIDDKSILLYKLALKDKHSAKISVIIPSFVPQTDWKPGYSLRKEIDKMKQSIEVLEDVEVGLKRITEEYHNVKYNLHTANIREPINPSHEKIYGCYQGITAEVQIDYSKKI